jgi:hypothetical protein
MRPYNHTVERAASLPAATRCLHKATGSMSAGFNIRGLLPFQRMPASSTLLNSAISDLTRAQPRLRTAFLVPRFARLAEVRRATGWITIHVGAWSLACGSPRTQASTPDSLTRLAATALVSK